MDETLFKDCPLNGMPLGERRSDGTMPIRKASSAIRPSNEQDDNGTSIPLQTKLTTRTLPLTELSAVDLSISEQKRNTRSLILVASLITTPQNLGGLSRCAEIFGAEALYIPSLSIMQHNLFLSVAVSSHLHSPILPVLPAGLPAFLRSKQAEGWTVVGVEQTDQSKVLGREGTVLPERCVLVMGAEKTGIPGVVLKECDLCVEIEQVEIMRSLNVQTAAATVLYEYGRLWGKDGVLIVSYRTLSCCQAFKSHGPLRRYRYRFERQPGLYHCTRHCVPRSIAMYAREPLRWNLRDSNRAPRFRSDNDRQGWITALDIRQVVATDNTPVYVSL